MAVRRPVVIMQWRACALLVAACLACASALELRVTQSVGSVQDVEKGVLRRADGSWRFEAAKLSVEAEAELAKAQPEDTLVTVRAALQTASGERVFMSSVPLVRFCVALSGRAQRARLAVLSQGGRFRRCLHRASG